MFIFSAYIIVNVKNMGKLVEKMYQKGRVLWPLKTVTTLNKCKLSQWTRLVFKAVLIWNKCMNLVMLNTCSQAFD